MLAYIGRENLRQRMHPRHFFNRLNDGKTSGPSRDDMFRKLGDPGFPLAEYLRDGLERARRSNVDLNWGFDEFDAVEARAATRTRGRRGPEGSSRRRES